MADILLMYKNSKLFQAGIDRYIDLRELSDKKLV
jgi:hypothetical protein